MVSTPATVAAVLDTAVWTHGHLHPPSRSIPPHTVAPQRSPSILRRTRSLYRGPCERRRDTR
jgi:hypothetical protein